MGITFNNLFQENKCLFASVEEVVYCIRSEKYLSRFSGSKRKSTNPSHNLREARQTVDGPARVKTGFVRRFLPEGPIFVSCSVSVKPELVPPLHVEVFPVALNNP